MANYFKKYQALIFVSMIFGLADASFANLDLASVPARPVQQLDPAAVGIDEKLGSHLNLDLLIQDETGKSVPLRSYFHSRKPVILSLLYFSCPGLCNYHLNGLVDGLKNLDWQVGQQFELISMSFDPKETSDLAAQKKGNYVQLLSQPGAVQGWHFVTADEPVIQQITQSVGFNYRWDEANKDWAHASAAIVLSPEGKITRYLPGVVFESRDLKLALLEAAEGKVGSIADRLLGYCFRYDSQQSRYSLMTSHLIQMGGGLLVLLISIFLLPFYLREKRSSATLP